MYGIDTLIFRITNSFGPREQHIPNKNAINFLIYKAFKGEEITIYDEGNFFRDIIYVSDVEKSAPFYRDVLGFELDGFAGDEANPYYAEMLAGPVKFGLHEPTMSGDELRIGQQRLYFRVRDIDSHRQYVESRGVKVGEILRRSWMDYFLVEDLDGNTIVFAVTDSERHTSEPWTIESL